MKRGWVLLISWMEIAGGLAGIAVWLQLVVTSGASLYAILVPWPFVVSVVAGFLLWRRRELGRRASLAVQALQIPVFALGPMSYAFVSGVQLGLSLDWPSLGFLTYAGGKLDVYVGAAPQSVKIGINIAAIWAYRVLGRVRFDGPLPAAQMFRARE